MPKGLVHLTTEGLIYMGYIRIGLKGDAIDRGINKTGYSLVDIRLRGLIGEGKTA
ncbi:hypothetical protein [Paenibacillus sp. TSA_86.1]|uniref:hypothetical protein n=1 Tax=Paenibacillus sp. TSA_86.1 TaxID=3415649 RepID=UPI0040463771